MPSWIVAPVVGLLGFLLAWGEWIEAAVGRRGHAAVRMVSVATLLLGAFFAREELVSVFVSAGAEVGDRISEAVLEGVPQTDPTSPLSSVPAP